MDLRYFPGDLVGIRYRGSEKVFIGTVVDPQRCNHSTVIRGGWNERGHEPDPKYMCISPHRNINNFEPPECQHVSYEDTTPYIMPLEIQMWLENLSTEGDSWI